jgi:Flp pilus assembly protein TadG
MSRERAARNERGAILVYVAICLLGLTAISAIVVDYGVFWVARRQAQNAADAGALAGVLARAFDLETISIVGSQGQASQAAHAVATAHSVWEAPPSVVPGTDITFPGSPVCPQTINCGPDCAAGESLCVRVDAHRTPERGAALPTFFAQLVGVSEQGVKATAMAQILSANATDCLAPLAVADRWDDFSTPSTPWFLPSARFNRYDATGSLLPNPDDYLPPVADHVGTGLNVRLLPNRGGIGFPLTLTEAPSPPAEIGSGQFIGVDLPRSTTATGSAFQANIEGCNGVPIRFGENLSRLSGSYIAQLTASASALRAQDPTATWNPFSQRIENSCAQGNPPCAPFSPRIITLPLFDPQRYEDSRWGGGTLELRVVNFIGFFIETVQSDRVIGRITLHSGVWNTTTPNITLQSAFLRTALLVR